MMTIVAKTWWQTTIGCTKAYITILEIFQLKEKTEMGVYALKSFVETVVRKKPRICQDPAELQDVCLQSLKLPYPCYVGPRIISNGGAAVLPPWGLSIKPDLAGERKAQ